MCGERRVVVGLLVGAVEGVVSLGVIAGVSATGDFPLVFDAALRYADLARLLGMTVGVSGTKT